jgi:UDP-N-acetylglucosamine--N-acetylmuramyl-(pentapeptide) pyrophosphoryl-undecaprenol N-acetylglucosamine transferase
MIVSGGGTGGHIFPAIAIANAVKEQIADADILFVGAQGRMEMEKVPQAGYPIEGLWISGFQRSLSLKNLMFPFKLISSLWKAKRIVKKFRPDVVVGTGGFASGPLLKAANSLGVPSLIQEQNSFPGVTNRILGKKAERICVAYDRMDQYFNSGKLMLTGNPVRKEVVQLKGKRPRALEYFNLNQDQPILLIVGGSLGSRSVNQAIGNGLKEITDNGFQVIWQTGKLTYNVARAKADEISAKGVVVTEFISRMDLAYAAADVVISRAGAIAVSELQLVQKPCILVPFPHAAEDHQTKNALALVTHEAAVLVKDHEASEKLVRTAIELLNDPNRRDRLSKNIAPMGIHDAAEIIAAEVIKIARKK